MCCSGQGEALWVFVLPARPAWLDVWVSAMLWGAWVDGAGRVEEPGKKLGYRSEFVDFDSCGG